jgi:hypothetical protein
MHAIARKLRQRRNNRQFERALRNATPSMRRELIAAASLEAISLGVHLSKVPRRVARIGR